jgi:hypothetical protein
MAGAERASRDHLACRGDGLGALGRRDSAIEDAAAPGPFAVLARLLEGGGRTERLENRDNGCVGFLEWAVMHAKGLDWSDDVRLPVTCASAAVGDQLRCAGLGRNGAPWPGTISDGSNSRSLARERSSAAWSSASGS